MCQRARVARVVHRSISAFGEGAFHVSDPIVLRLRWRKGGRLQPSRFEHEAPNELGKWLVRDYLREKSGDDVAIVAVGLIGPWPELERTRERLGCQLLVRGLGG